MGTCNNPDPGHCRIRNRMYVSDRMVGGDLMAEYIVSGDILAGIEGSISNGELIRCKDCKYWQTNTQFCTRWSAPFATQHTSPNWYCADGEPKDGDTE